MERIDGTSSPDGLSVLPGRSEELPSARAKSAGDRAQTVVLVSAAALLCGALSVGCGISVLRAGWNLSHGAGVPGTWYAEPADCTYPDVCGRYGIFTQANHDGLPERLYLDSSDTMVIVVGDRLQVNRRYDPAAHRFEAYVGDGGSVGDFVAGSLVVLISGSVILVSVLRLVGFTPRLRRKAKPKEVTADSESTRTLSTLPHEPGS